MVKFQAQRKLEATSETIADYDATINKFRDLVSSLQVSEGKYECITDDSVFPGWMLFRIFVAQAWPHLCYVCKVKQTIGD